VIVTYSVASVAAGTTDTIVFTARSVADSAASEDGRLEITVVRPDIALAKSVNPNGVQGPGTDLTYTVTFTNTGTTDAVNVEVVDSLAVELEFKVGSIVNNPPTGIGVTVQYSNDGGSSWTYTPVSAGCGGLAGYDACVTHVRWRLQDDMSAAAPDNTGNVQFVARIK
jgi:uncharacterized repeat protein (TIGR01451 family)